ncbi:hypothetical protein J7L18_05230 [Candidatus Bathyarchaeota archaeon]|nr:hypothetical protein [Candidatus Bathyarchaeota archaeon]RLG95015.1 MAG: hypothetical protein DRO37_03785 [Candidatus Bathyarchaeota archaeon]
MPSRSSSIIIPAIKKGITYFGYKAYLLLIDEWGISGFCYGKLLGWKDILTRLILGLLGGLIGKLIFGGTQGAILGAIAMTGSHDPEIEKQSRHVLDELASSKMAGNEEFLIPTSSIRVARLKIGKNDLSVLKIRVGWRGRTFLIRRKDADRIEPILIKFLRNRFEIEE